MSMKSLLSLLTVVFLAISTLFRCVHRFEIRDKRWTGIVFMGERLSLELKLAHPSSSFPQGYSFTASTPLGRGMPYQAKYAAVGTICFDNLLIMDGINEKGLSVGTFYFPGFAGYTPTTQENQDHSLSPIDFSNWILTQFASLDEVKSSLKNIVIAPTVIKDWGNTPPPFHYIVYDKKGESIVIEPVDGKLNVYNNPLERSQILLLSIGK